MAISCSCRSRLKSIASAVAIITTPNTFRIPVALEDKNLDDVSARLPPYAIRRRGTPAPKPYAIVRKTAVKLTFPVSASVVTDARIGPAQGVERSPREIPRRNPPKKPVFFVASWDWSLLPMLETKAVSCSNPCDSVGKIMVAPKKAIAAIAIYLKISGLIPVACTMAVRESVKNEKLRIKQIGRAHV